MKKKLLKLKWMFLVLLFPFSAMAQNIYFVDASKADNSGAGTSWTTAKKDLQTAINSASSGDAVWVKAGTYLPTHDPFGSTAPANNRDKTFTLKNGVKVYGGFAGTETLLSQRDWKTNQTILSGDLGTTNVLADNAYHVVISVNLTNATVLDGVTITKGYATAPSTSKITVGTRVLPRYHGGGIFNTFSATNFVNCKITFNSADCTNTDDDALGAGVLNNSCSSSFTNCVIESNSFLVGGSSFGVFGAGMVINGGSCSILNSVFSNNTGGSGFLDSSRGGALVIDGTANIVNSVFYNNSAQNGAALLFGGGDANLSTVTNCSFVNNTGSFVGVGYQGFSKAIFKNCLFWNNTPTSNPVVGRDEIYSQENRIGFQPTFINCIIRDATGNPLAITNTVLVNSSNSNPLFVNSADGDGVDNQWATADDGLTLQNSSPAKNSGITGSGIPTLDIVGNIRDSQPDLGAYEYQVPCINPIPYNLSGGGTYCAGGVGHVVNVLNSEIGVMYQLKNGTNNVGFPLNGNGASIGFGNQTAAGTYTVVATRTVGGCSSTMNGSVTINITPKVTPTFTAVNPICAGEILAPLPTTSNNGITGTWAPALSNTQTKTYTFTPSTGQCAETATLTVTVNSTPTPTGASNQTINVTNSNDATIEDLIVNPTNVIWYASLANANSNTNALPVGTVLTDGASYYAKTLSNGCYSGVFAVTVTVNITLGIGMIEKQQIEFFPVPSSDLVFINATMKINEMSLYNASGQKIKDFKTNSKNVTIDLSQLAVGVYHLKTQSSEGAKTITLIKK
jgi:hypothetical protein